MPADENKIGKRLCKTQENRKPGTARELEPSPSQMREAKTPTSLKWARDKQPGMVAADHSVRAKQNPSKICRYPNLYQKSSQVARCQAMPHHRQGHDSPRKPSQRTPSIGFHWGLHRGKVQCVNLTLIWCNVLQTRCARINTLVLLLWLCFLAP